MNDIFNYIRTYVAIIMTFITFFFGANVLGDENKDVLTDEETVRIMSFNIRSGEYEPRFDIVPTLIDEYKPDSVGVQECTFNWYTTLKVFLTDYAVVGVGRENGKLNAKCGELSAIFYLKDKYNLVDSGTFWISETPDEPSFGWDAACKRVCTWAILENKETGERYAHVNTHLDHVGSLAQKNGAEMVSEFALTFDIPTVVTGDFNVRKNSDCYKIVIGNDLIDTQDVAESTMYGKTFHNYNGGEDGLPIDFIFVNSKVDEVLTYKIVRDTYDGQHSSDHYPIYADIKF